MLTNIRDTDVPALRDVSIACRRDTMSPSPEHSCVPHLLL